MSLPTNVKGGRSFLRHARFSKRFIKDISKISKPLCNILEKIRAFNFDEVRLKAFSTLKEDLISAPIIASLDWSIHFELMCSANDCAIDIVLRQCINNDFHTIYYANKILSESRVDYTIMEKELLIVVYVVDKF